MDEWAKELGKMTDAELGQCLADNYRGKRMFGIIERRPPPIWYAALAEKNKRYRASLAAEAEADAKAAKARLAGAWDNYNATHAELVTDTKLRHYEPTQF